jgi:hypothetical protein
LVDSLPVKLLLVEDYHQLKFLLLEEVLLVLPLLLLPKI